VRCRSLTTLTAPSHNEPREKIEDRRRVQLAALDQDGLGRIADPALAECLGREVSGEQIAALFSPRSYVVSIYGIVSIDTDVT
jgi:hypothetical protein